MRILLALAFIFQTALALAQSYTDAEAAQHDGEIADVHGKVNDVHVFDSGMVLINFGSKYPSQTFTAVIFAKQASQFPDPKSYKGKTLSVHGTIRIHKNKPE